MADRFALEYVDQVLAYAHEKVTQHPDSPDLHSSSTQNNLLNLLLAPIHSYLSLFTTLILPHYLPLLHAQTYQTRRAVAGQVARSLLQAQKRISTPENLDGVLEILQVIIKEGAPQPSGPSGVQAQRRTMETEETIEEQGWLARIVHLIQSPDNDTQYQVCGHAVIRNVTRHSILADHDHNDVVIRFFFPPPHTAFAAGSKGIRRWQRTDQVHHSALDHLCVETGSTVQDQGTLRR